VPDTKRMRLAARRRRELYASRYRPYVVDLLIVAQAPPAELDRYFYYRDVRRQDSLFREVARSVLKVEPTRDNKRELLDALRDRGVFLIDVSLEPIPKGTPLGPMIPGLIRRVRRLGPRRIILVKADVYSAAFSPLRDSGLPVVDADIPFPGYGRQIEFRDAFGRALGKSRRLVARRRSPARRDQLLDAGAPSWLDRFIDDDAEDVLAESSHGEGLCSGPRSPGLPCGS
jgi:hypothetical protein